MRKSKNTVKSVVIIISVLLLASMAVGIIVSVLNKGGSIFPTPSEHILTVADKGYKAGETLALATGKNEIGVNVDGEYTVDFAFYDKAKSFDIVVDGKYYSFPGEVDVANAFPVEKTEKGFAVTIAGTMENVVQSLFPDIAAEKIEVPNDVDFSKTYFVLNVHVGEKTYSFPITCNLNGSGVKVFLDTKEIIF